MPIFEPYRIRSLIPCSQNLVAVYYDHSAKDNEIPIRKKLVVAMGVIERQYTDEEEDDLILDHNLEGFCVLEKDDGTRGFTSCEEPPNEDLEFLGYDNEQHSVAFWKDCKKKKEFTLMHNNIGDTYEC